MDQPTFRFELVDSAPKRLRLILKDSHSQLEPLRDVVRAVRDAGVDLEVRVTFEGGDARRFAAQAAREGRDVIAMGGDGTLHEAINGLCDAAENGGPTPSALGIIPGGTGNDFATVLGLPSDDLAEAFRVVLNGRRKPIDILKARVSMAGDSSPVVAQRVLNVATLGLGAAVTADAPESTKKWLGNLAYVIAGVRKAHELEAQEINVRGEDASGHEFQWRGSAFGLAVGNGRTAGGGAMLLPKAMLDDGLLDLVICPEMPFGRLLPVVGDALAGESLIGDLMRMDDGEVRTESDEPYKLVYRQLRRVKIDALDCKPINLDGESCEGTSARFEVEPLRATLFAPRQSPVISRG